MELIEYWYLLLKHKFLILFLVLLFGGGGYYYLTKITPTYQSTAKLLFTEENGMSGLGLSSGTDMMLSAIGKKSDPLMTQIEIIKTRPIMDETIARCSLVTEDGERISSEALLSSLTFSVITNTNLIKMSCINTSPQKAAEILNTLSEVYIAENQRLNRESAKSAKVFIEEQISTQKSKLDAAEAAEVAYKENIGFVSLEAETKVKIEALATLKTNLIQIESQLQGLYAERSDIQSKIDQQGARNSSLYSRWKGSLEDLKTQIASLKAQKNSINAKINKRNRELSTIPEQQVLYANLVRDKEIATQVYAKLLESYDKLRIQEAASVSNIQVVEPAIVAEEPVGPQKKKILALALIAGFMIAFGISLLLEYLDDSPRSVDEVAKILDGSILGSTPFFNKKLSSTFVKDNSESFAAESMRIIHTNMKFTGALNDKNNAIMLTSSQPGEGKSTLSMNLAMTYAELGSKTAVVNLDLRRPSFHKILGTEMKKGITDYLIGDASLEDISYKSIFNGLTIIPAGTIPPNPTVLLGSEKMMKLIEELKREFDFVIFDTPPVTMVSESLDVARHMNGIIQIVDISNASLRAIKYMATIFDGKNLPVLGTIINKMGKGNSKRYGQSYTFDYSKYGYYSDLKK